MLRFPLLWIIFAAAGLSACGVSRDRSPAIGEAYAGPATLVLRRDIDPKSPSVAVVHHGDKLEIVAQRRRWYRVRTANGMEGWADDRQLLDSVQMNRLRKMAQETAGLPSQGVATSFDALNVHTEPNRHSPSFIQVREGEKFDLIAHRVAQRVVPPKRRLIPPRPKTQKKGKEKVSRVAPPPSPNPPPPPENWLELSKQRSVAADDSDDPQVPEDDWTLIRTKNGQSGWVLTSRLYMAIPDEVAQYAEGHRISSYFSIGKIPDGTIQKDIWLWTTVERLGQDHDFDGYRVFVWSVRRHRYETGYIQRRVRGFFPVLAKTGEFSVCLENQDGGRVRKQYVLQGYLVRPAGERPCEGPAAIEEAEPAQPATSPGEKAAAKKGFFEGIKDKLKSFVHH